MNFPSIRIEGGILSPDIPDRIEDADGQKPAHFELDSSAKVKDEILRVWADAQHYWNAFQHKIESLKADSPATTETRNLWIVPLLSLLGYQLEYQARGAELNGKIYPISHRVTNRKHTPLHVIGYREPSGLDRKPEKMALRMSAHALVQEYLNLSDELYGIVTNGRLLRVLRDSSRLVKLNYLEFDLDRIFTDGLFADFAVLLRLLHGTRLPKNEETAASCWLERYHQKSIDEGTRIRDGLRDAVTEALELLGTGFLAHPENTALRQQILSGELRPEAYFSHLLRLVYRLLFLMVIEERGLIFPKGMSSKNVSLYFQNYSVQRLRRMALTRGLKVERFHDAWLSLLSTFQLFENLARASKLGTTVFGGQLFNPESLDPLIKCRLTNAALFAALERLCYFDHPKTKQRTPVNFGALATEEFGSVYESLLELHPVVETEPTPHFGFRQVAGNERKITGSYYTPTSLVTCLLDSALDPVLEDRIRNFKALGFKSVDEAVLALNVCDPACGSGHFLIAAAQRIARRLALLRAGEEEPSPEMLRHTLREVIGHCIHGVDVNPMSVELCKVALWLEAVEPGKPLNFFDHHIRRGNSLLGATPEAIREGIPDEAYEPITGDSTEAAKWMRKLNKDAREGQSHFDFANAKPWERLGNLPAAMAELETLEDETPEALAKKEKLYQQIVGGSGYENARLLHDTWCAAFVWPKYRREYGSELTTEHLRKIERNPHSVAPNLKTKIRELAEEYRFFHWHLEFPAVFGADGKGGFDVILGNPPWEKIQPEEQQFFSGLRSDISDAVGNERKRLIASLAKDAPDVFKHWQDYKRKIEGWVHFIRHTGEYLLSAHGKLNTYGIFLELAWSRLSQRGRAGMIVQTGLVIDDSNKELISALVNSKSLRSVYDFENKEVLFPAVHPEQRFCLVTVERAERPTDKTDFAFWLLQVEDLHDPERHFTLTREDLLRLSPNTGAIPTFRTRREASVITHMYAVTDVMTNESTSEPGWIAKPTQFINLTSDSSQFLRSPHQSEEVVPVYEGKLTYAYDHRYATFSNHDRDAILRGVSDEEHRNAEFVITPQYWMRFADFKEHLSEIRWNRTWFLSFHDIANPNNERTSLFTIVPLTAVGNSAPVFTGELGPLSACCLLAGGNSIAFDFVTRRRIVSRHLNFFILKQLPLPRETEFQRPCAFTGKSSSLGDWMLPRVSELTYTAWDLEPFARDCGFDGPPFRWDEERRFQIRCELDAAFFYLYLGSEEEWRRQSESLTKYFPTPRDAVSYIMDTFPILKRKDEEKFGTYRTMDTILSIYDALAESQRTGRPFISPLNPPPGPPTDEHGHFIPMSQWDPNHWRSHIHPPRKASV